MSSFEVTGGKRLHGTIIPQGAKNEALQILCAVLLTPEPVQISNIPDIRDVNKLIELLGELGVNIEKNSPGTFTFEAKDIRLDYMKTPEYMAKAASLRGSVMMLGPLLARFKKAYLPQPGGDKIGRRRLDTHFVGFQKLGARFLVDPEKQIYSLEGDQLQGCYMLLDEASVTGTANIIMAAVMARGTTTIFNAACEPYLVQLCEMLVRM